MTSRRRFIGQLAGLGASAIGATALVRCAASAPAPTKRTRRIGYLSTAFYAQDRSQWNPTFLQDLRDLGYVEGHNVFIDVRLAEGVPERLPSLAAELVALSVDVLVTSGGPSSALAAKQATGTIPIVFNGLSDPVGSGIVQDLARPGANVTGVANPGPNLAVKRLELLNETVPGLARVIVFFAASDPSQLILARATEETGRTLGVDINAIAVNSMKDLDVALDATARLRPHALIDCHGPQFYGRDLRELLKELRADAGFGKLLEFSVRHRLPQIYSGAEFARAGGLIGLGASSAERWRATAELVDKILKGVDPADLPVRISSTFDLALNLSMSQRIGLAIPESVMRQVTEVVR